jgi:hypothetical protein
MVRRSWLTRIRPESAAIFKTSESSKPASPASAAVRMSAPGSARRNSRSTRPSRSASAWNLTRITRPLQLCDQFGVRLPRLVVLFLRNALPFRQVLIDLFLVAQVKGERAEHLFQG